MSDDKKQDPSFGFRCPEQVGEALDRAAGEGDRTRSAQILRYVKQGLKRDGLLREPR